MKKRKTKETGKSALELTFKLIIEYFNSGLVDKWIAGENSGLMDEWIAGEGSGLVDKWIVGLMGKKKKNSNERGK